MTDPTAAFSKMVPGFDFLQSLMKNAGAAMPPGVGQWIAPTLNPEDLEKRIEELRTVQFWLEQNARMLAASIQALEVQRMTLTTLKSMNVSMSDLTESLKIRMPEPAPPPAPAAAPAPEPAPEPVAAAQPPAAPGLPQAPAGVIDPVQWWGALTQQFAQLAASALKDSAGDASGSAAAPAKASRGAGGSAAKTAAAKKSTASTASSKTPAARRAAKPR